VRFVVDNFAEIEWERGPARMKRPIERRTARISAANAISRADLYRLMQELGRGIETFNSEPLPGSALRNLQEYWLSIRLP
jgi:hypothetical protein